MKTQMLTSNLCLLLLLCFSPFTFAWEDDFRAKYQIENSALHAPRRILDMMEDIYVDAEQRHTDLNVMRFMYEESPQYETGYIISEIIERYRKMVMHLKRVILLNKADTVFDTLKRVEVIQKLYFEVYHLSNMNNEIRRKWRQLPEFISLDETPIDTSGFDRDKQRDRDQEKYDAKRKAEEKKRNDEFRKRLAELINNRKKKEKTNKEYNRWWPLDYGWEINYYW